MVLMHIQKRVAPTQQLEMPKKMLYRPISEMHIPLLDSFQSTGPKRQLYTSYLKTTMILFHFSISLHVYAKVDGFDMEKFWLSTMQQYITKVTVKGSKITFGTIQMSMAIQ